MTALAGDAERPQETTNDVASPGHPSALADAGRLAALHRTGLLDTGPEEAFDRFTRLAVRALGVPVALVSLVDRDRQFFKSCIGLPEPYATSRQTPLSHSFCQYTVMQRSPLIIRDARIEPLVAQNMAIDALGVVAYAGMPLITGDGQVLGSFCAIDTEPHDWSTEDLAVLRDLSEAVVTEIELRLATADAIERAAVFERERAEISALLHSAAEGIYGIDREGRCTFVNTYAARALGYEDTELIGQNMHALMHHTRSNGDAYPEHECPISQAVSRGQGVRLDKEVLWRRDGSSFLAEYSAQPVMREGALSGAVVTFLDVTQRQEAERRLAVQHAVASVMASSQDLDQALPRLLETIGGGLDWDVGLFWRVSGDVLSCDHSWQGPGVDADEFVQSSRSAQVQRGHGLVGAVWAEAQPVWVTDLQQEPRFARIRGALRDRLYGALAFPVLSGETVHGVIELLSHKRRPPDLELRRTLAVLGYQIGQFVARLRAEEWLHIATRAIAAASSGISISDAQQPDKPLLYVNPAFTAITGYSTDEAVGRNCRFLQGAETDREEVGRLRSAIINGEQYCAVLLNYRKDGAAFWNELTISPVTDAAGDVTHYIGIQVDISVRRRIERELEEARQASEAASLAKSRFLANMSHELRTPLNAVILYSELLQEEAEDRGVPEFIPDLEKIRGAGRHLLSLINTVLDLAKVESGKDELHLETFSVTDAVKDVVATCLPLVQKNRNTIDVQLADGLGLMRTDIVKLRQILFNFLSNAAKFTENGSVVLEVAPKGARAGDVIEFRVRDTGIGMSAEQLARLFQPFSQADESITRRYGGTGLGLALCMQLAELMGGSVDVTSEPGVGTEFTATLPRNVSDVLDNLMREGERATDGYALIIDDDPAAREELMRALADEGIPAVAASDGVEGLRLAGTFQPSIIFLDVIMPQLDGWKVLAALKADQALAAVPVVMVTLSPTEDLGYLLGADDYLLKPLDQTRLIHVLHRHGSLRGQGSVLVIDDDDATRAVLRKLLAREGWNVEEAVNGRAGLERLAAVPTSLILLDLIMPEMDGFEFITALRRQPAWRSMPVVVMTSKDLTQEDRARLAGTVQSIIGKGARTREEVLREVREIARQSAVALRTGLHDASITFEPRNRDAQNSDS